MTDALVFDMDGLIFDSERIVQRSWESAGDQLGFTHLGEHIYNTLGMNVHRRKEYFAKAIGEDFPYEEFSQRSSVCYRQIVDAQGVPVKQGVRELLAFAREQGLRLAVATSTREVHAAQHLKEAGLYELFDCCVYGDMVSRSKPDPQIYLLACKRIGTPPHRSIALEDSPAGIQSAYAAGMKPIMIPDLVQPDATILKLLFKKFDTLCEVIPFLQGTLPSGRSATGEDKS